MPGILFLLIATFACGEMDLAVSLFEEGDWLGCHRESLRVLSEGESPDQAELLNAVSLIRLGRADASVTNTLRSLAADAESGEVRAMAAYELARRQWAAGEDEAAFESFKICFGITHNEDLFLRSGCSMWFLAKAHPLLIEGDPATQMQLATASGLWNRFLKAECSRPPDDDRNGSSLLSKPGQWVVSFYRDFVRPSIGARCVLEPSCSEYCRQASHEHGLMAFPMIADRLIREPTMVMMQQNPTNVNGSIRYADPISDHDEWFRK